MTTLYRQYRPKVFSEVVGQDHVINTLKKAMSTDRIAHAYLFYGPRGTGKTTTARILAKRLNCKDPKGAEPCLKCKTCKASDTQQNIDLIEIDAASNRGIDDIRSLQEGINLAPSMGKYKIYIIDEVHMLTREAFTALLKTLEEPVKHAIFILATTESHKIPETIVSRCQVYRFKRATSDEMRSRLEFLLKKEEREIDDNALNFVINRSDGCYRDAESLLGQLITLHDKKVTINELTELLGLAPRDLIDKFITSLIKGESTDAVVAIDKAFANGHDPEQFLNEAIYASRDGALSLIKKEEFDLSFTDRPDALSRLPLVIRALIQASQDLAYVPQPLIALHLAVLTLCDKQGSPVMPQPQKEIKQAVVTPQPEKKPSPPAQEEVVIPEENNKPGDISLEAAKRAWPELIQTIRTTNPVAATFLRAMEPVAMNGDVIKVRAQYTLHSTFFDKQVNKRPIEDVLSKIVKSRVLISCFLDEKKMNMNTETQEEKKEEEEKLLSTVKEVFG